MGGCEEGLWRVYEGVSRLCEAGVMRVCEESVRGVYEEKEDNDTDAYRLICSWHTALALEAFKPCNSCWLWVNRHRD